jgi:hypothetical protein
VNGARVAAARFHDLVRSQLLPGLAALGFDGHLPGSLAATEALGVVWLLDLERAPWSTRDKIDFSVRWGIHVPGLDEAVGDAAPAQLTVSTCAVSGRISTGVDDLEARWFTLRKLPPVVATVADQALGQSVLRAIRREVLPRLEALSTPVDVQQHLHRNLVAGRGNADHAELQVIRRIAALSLLLRDRANASRWLDYLEARSAATMAPDVVAERLAPLRERLAS